MTGSPTSIRILAAALGTLRLAYLHLVDHSAMGAPKPEPATVTAMCREIPCSRRAGSHPLRRL